MAVAVIPKIVNMIIIASKIADLVWPHQEAIIVVILLLTFTVIIADVNDLRRKARDRRVLAEQIGDVHIVAARPFAHRVEAAIGVLLKSVEIGEVVLPAIGLPIAKQAKTELLILKQKTPKVDIE